MSVSDLIPSFKKPCGNKDYSKLMREDCKIELKVAKEIFDEPVRKIGDVLHSQTFPRGGDAHFKWQLEFYPLGVIEEHEGYSSVFLCLIWKKIRVPVPTVVRFEIKCNETDMSVEAEEMECVYLKGHVWGFPRFCEVNDLRTFNTDYFLICAQVCVNYEAISCFTSNFLSTRNLLHNYSRLFESGAFSDLILCTREGETEFNVHRSILASRSTVFAAMLSSDMKEKQTGRIEILDLSSSTVKSMLNFIYSCEVEFENVEGTFELLGASEKYDLKDLKLQCAEYLEEILDENNIGIILVHAHRYNLFNLKATCLTCICKNKCKFSDRKQYQIIQGKNSDLLLDIITEFSKYVEVDKIASLMYL